MVRVQAKSMSHGSVMGEQLLDLNRCPHCAIAKPHLTSVWASPFRTERTDGGTGFYWAAYQCSACGSITAAKGTPDNRYFQVHAIFPDAKVAHLDIPEVARRFLQQAYDTLHAPDASAVMAGSAVDAMLKAIGYEDGSVYTRIDTALNNNKLTEGMAKWAHSVRLGSNRPRHADVEKPHVTPEEAMQSVEFAEALGNFLFVLTAKIERGIEAAQLAEAEAPT